MYYSFNVLVYVLCILEDKQSITHNVNYIGAITFETYNITWCQESKSQLGRQILSELGKDTYINPITLTAANSDQMLNPHNI